MLTGAGAAALAAAWGWLSAAVLWPRWSTRSLIAAVVAALAVAAEALVIGGTAAGVTALAGVVAGAGTQRTWLRALGARTLTAGGART